MQPVGADQAGAGKCPRSGAGGWRLAVAFVIAIDVLLFLLGARLLDPAPVYHDNGELAYPLRVLVSTALREGVLPAWDHWTHGGAPLCSLVTALPLSPLVLALGAFDIYGVRTFVVELLLVHLLALLGMFCWLRASVAPRIALLGAVCYALSAVFLVQAPINVEAVATQAMLPWYALGLRRGLEGRLPAAGLIACALWVMFTTGYLGLDLIALELLSLHGVLDHLAVQPGGRRAWRGVAVVAFGWLLGAGILTPALLETYRHFQLDLSQLREAGFDPFTGASRPAALVTWLWPNGVSAFLEDQNGRHAFPLYAGSAVCLLVVSACDAFRRSNERPLARRVALLLVFAVLAFAATLPAAWGGELFTTILPLYDQTRFHCWGVAVVVFFTVTLAALGWRHLESVGGARDGVLAAFVVGALGLLAVHQADPDAARLLSYPQLYASAGLALVVSRRLRLDWRLRTYVVLAITLAEIAAVSPQLLSLRDSLTGHRAALLESGTAALAANEETKTAGFPAPPNTRSEIAPGNRQYFTKTPTLAGYNPNIHPAVRRLLEGAGLPKPLFGRILYAVDDTGRPLAEDALAVELTRFTPDRVEARVESRVGATRVTWSSPFTPAWHLSIDDAPAETRANTVDLTTFAVPPGAHTLALRYRPPGMTTNIAVAVGSALLAVCLAAAALRRDSQGVTVSTSAGGRPKPSAET